MKNQERSIRNSISSLATNEGADFGYAYVERLNTTTFKIQTSQPLQETDYDFDAAIKRVIEIASHEITEPLTLPGEFTIAPAPMLKYKTA